MSRRTVLIVDDEPDIRELLEVSLGRMGIDSEAAATVAQARDCLARRAYDLVLTDMRLPDGDGLGVIATTAQLHPSTPVAVITAYGSTENAVAALKAGAFDYLAKPIRLWQLRPLVADALRLPPTGGKRKAPAVEREAPVLVGDSEPIVQVRSIIARIARTQAPVAITGESGTGKEVAARLIHAGSSRAAGPFVAVNCGAIPETLLEAEFFGFRKGAFTGATEDRPGFFQAAEGGSLFLDEIGDLPLALQAKLLRFLQDRRIERVGGRREITVDVRIVAATNRDLQAMIREGRFREDLLFRLDEVSLRLPPLRDRPGDVVLLVEHFVAAYNRDHGRSIRGLAPDAVDAVLAHAWPGNVREVENRVKRAVIMADARLLGAADLGLEPAPGAAAESYDLRAARARAEGAAIRRALLREQGNVSRAARLLGVSRPTLYESMKQLGITV